MLERFRQIKVIFESTRESDPRLVPYMALAALVGLGIPLGVGFILGNPILWGLVGLGTAILGATVVLSRRATSMQYEAIEGQPGAAAAVLEAMRGKWHVTPVVVVTRKQDMVHRATGRPGVVLVGEGSPARVKGMLKKEKQKMERVTGDVPVHTVLVGSGEGQVTLRKLRTHLMKLPRELKKGEVGDLETKLSALGGTNIPIPKGPIPRGGRRR